MKSDIFVLYGFMTRFAEDNKAGLGEIKFDIDEEREIIKIEKDSISEYCFYYKDELVYIKADEFCVYETARELIDSVIKAKEEYDEN